jgi:hypothetical protein
MFLWQAVALKICHDYHLLLTLKDTLAKGCRDNDKK